MKATTGKGAVILPHGVLFRGNAEAHIRRQLVRSGMLKGIIGLPANLFYGTGIPACILVLDKENASARKGIFMLDASKGFIKDGPKNRLREQDIHRIVDTFRRGVDVPRYARMVPLDEIASQRNDYNLNLPRYIDSSEPEDLQDIDAHLNGGIPERDLDAFAADWQEMPALRQALFEPLRPGYARLRQPISEVRAIILAHPQFLHFQSKVATLFGKWQQAVMPLLTGIQPGDKPKALITQVSETLLATFHAAPLLDPYDVYQHLMDYWAETMQDGRLGSPAPAHRRNRQEGQNQGQGLGLRPAAQALYRRPLLRRRTGRAGGNAGRAGKPRQPTYGAGGRARRRGRAVV